MYWVQQSYIIFSLWVLWHSWLWQLCKSLCSRCAQRRVNTLNAKLNPICHLLALLAHHILHVSRIRVNLNVMSFLTDFNQCWNVPLNLVHSHNTKFDKNLRGFECYNVHGQAEGFFLTGGLQSCKHSYNLTK